jgi:hypothetical protein
MLRIHKRLFYDVCNKDIDIYYEVISIIRHDYYETLHEINLTRSGNLQILIHKMIGIVCGLECNSELIYLCRQISNNCKWSRATYNYSPYLEELFAYNIERLLC